MRSSPASWRAARVGFLVHAGLCYFHCHADTVSRDVEKHSCPSQSGWALLQTKSNLAKFVDTSEELDKDVAAARHPMSNHPVEVARHVGEQMRAIASNVNASSSVPSSSEDPDVRHIRKNAAGDFKALLTSIGGCGIGIFICMLVFNSLRKRYPPIYSNNVLCKKTSIQVQDSFLGWWKASMALKTEEVSLAVGLDAAMYLEFLHMCICLLAVISVPMIGVGLLHARFGHNMDDMLGRTDITNIGLNSGLAWVHAGLVWFVVVLGVRTTFNAFNNFMPRRVRWLHDLPFPESTSVLVQGIPPRLRTDAALHKYFEEILPSAIPGIGGAVHSCLIVKQTDELSFLVAKVQRAREMLYEAEFAQERRLPEAPWLSQACLEVEMLRVKVEALELEVCTERAKVKSAIASGDPDVHLPMGFVTFRDKRDKALALCLRCTTNIDELVISPAPNPSDIDFANLKVDLQSQRSWKVLGNVLLVILFLIFLPITVAISSAARLQTLVLHVDLFRRLVAAFPAVRAVWDGLMASTTLSCTLAVVPSLLSWIYQCFHLNTGTRNQHFIQNGYFIFLVVFVLFVTSLGNSLLGAIYDVVATHTSLIHRLAINLPMASHFYNTYLVVQTFSYALEWLRILPLLRFISWRKVCHEERARELSEDANDIGARSAVISFHFILALVFSSISPLICIMALTSFVFARAFYGYLIMFVEPAPPDVGGKFWYTQLRHVQRGLFIYIVLMSAVVAHRSSSWIPSVVSLSSLLYFWPMYTEFGRLIQHWHNLPVEELVREGDLQSRKSHASAWRGSYLQPELEDNLLSAEFVTE